MINKTILIGNLGKDPNKLAGHDNMVGVSVATTESWKDQNGAWHKKATWHDCLYFGKNLDFILKLKKGDQVYVEGAYLSKKSNDREKFVKISRISKFYQKSENQNQSGSGATQSNDYI